MFFFFFFWKLFKKGWNQQNNETLKEMTLCIADTVSFSTALPSYVNSLFCKKGGGIDY